MFRVREPTSSSASKLLFLVLLSLLLRSCYCPLYFTHHLYLPFKLSLVCMLVPRALWGPLYFQALIPLLALKWKQLQPPPVSSPHLNSKVIHSLSSFKAKVVISLCRLIPSNGKRKIYLADQYSCTPIITAKLISRIFFDKKKAVKSLLTRKGALCHSKLKEKKKFDSSLPSVSIMKHSTQHCFVVSQWELTQEFILVFQVCPQVSNRGLKWEKIKP